MAGKDKLDIEGKGSIRLELVLGKKVTLSDVLYVLNCSRNHVSIRQLDFKRVKTTITGGSLRAEITNGQLLFTAESRWGLYMLNVAPIAFKVFEDYNPDAISKSKNYQGIKRRWIPKTSFSGMPILVTSPKN